MNRIGKPFFYLYIRKQLKVKKIQAKKKSPLHVDPESEAVIKEDQFRLQRCLDPPLLILPSRVYQRKGRKREGTGSLLHEGFEKYRGERVKKDVCTLLTLFLSPSSLFLPCSLSSPFRLNSETEKNS